MENQREPMVEVVNAFYQGCGLEVRCRASSHIALEECAGQVWSRVDPLRDCYRRTLAEAGMTLV
ncbi:hypothetical protein FQZ97_1216470 [compost metagenome]